MLEAGDTAPEFELPGTDGETHGTYRLSDYTDAGTVVLAFYPADFSPVCTDELCAFRDVEWLSVRDDVSVFGISVDSVYSHSHFINEYGFGFPLLTDRLGEVASGYGVRYDEWEGQVQVAKRAIFAIDENRTVRYRWFSDDPWETPNLDDLNAALDVGFEE